MEYNSNRPVSAWLKTGQPSFDVTVCLICLTTDVAEPMKHSQVWQQPRTRIDARVDSNLFAGLISPQSEQGYQRDCNFSACRRD